MPNARRSQENLSPARCHERMNDDLEPGGPRADPAVGTGTTPATPDADAPPDANSFLHTDVEQAPPHRLDAPVANRAPQPPSTHGRGIAIIIAARPPSTTLPMI